MAIPITAETLIDGKVVEQSRIEYKKGWNPKEVLQTLCAFANDIENLGGGYIIIGVEAKDGLPIKPIAGISESKLDGIEKELLRLCHMIRPLYLPICEPVKYRGKHILLIWAPGGYDRPYQAQVSLSNENKEDACFIRRYSNTVKANKREMKQLYEVSEVRPFDDRPNLSARISDMSLGRMIDYLYRVESSLTEDEKSLNLEDVSGSLRVAIGPPEDRHPLNVGLLFFTENPEDYLREVHIDIVSIPDPTGEGMVEWVFTGPLDRQLGDALSMIKNVIIAEKVHKVPNQAEAERYFNYPYRAIEEALTNAVYHKSYQIAEPITVRIENNNLSILSLPGPDPSITDANLAAYRMVSSHNRNRRIGEFLKELNMTEGRNTGIPTMIRECERNGSPLPVIFTDRNRSYMRIVFPIHKDFRTEGEDWVFTPNMYPEGLYSMKAPDNRPKRRTRKQLREDVLYALRSANMSKRELYAHLGYEGNASASFSDVVKQLLVEKYLAYTTSSSKNPSAKLFLLNPEDENERGNNGVE
jgi:ATP-dependent DNA helicase RecG